MRYFALSLLLLTLAVCLGCAKKEEEPPPAPEAPPEETAEPPRSAELSFETFAGGGPEFRAVIDDPDVLSATFRSYAHSPEPMPGMGSTVVFTFTGLKAGATALTVEERSPIADNLDHVYRATVDEGLNVTLEHVETRAAFAQEGGA